MPVLRLMADGRPILASPGQVDEDGTPAFPALRGGDTVRVEIDCTAYLGAAGETIGASAWTAHGATLGAQAQAGATVSALVTLPGTGTLPWTGACWGAAAAAHIVHRLTTSGGRVHTTPLRLGGGSCAPAYGGVWRP